jgi:hypothetical protein
MPSPRIDQDEAASREIRHIAGRQFGDAGHRGDLDVKGLDRSALTTGRGDDLGVVGGGMRDLTLAVGTLSPGRVERGEG